MKKLLLLVSALLLASTLGFAGNCTTGPLSGYIGNSCTLPSGQVIDVIAYTPTGSNQVLASAITVTPGSQGFVLTATWSVSGTETSNGNLIFSDSGTYNTAGLAIGGVSVSGGGVAESDEIITNGTTLMVTSPSTLSDIVSIPPNTGTLIFDKDLSLTANGGSASMSSLTETISETTSTTPEMSSLFLFATGALIMGLMVSRRKRHPRRA